MTTARAKERPARTFPTVGCCGIDCGLCPRYHTAGSSRCPGCAGPGFFQKHPACGVLSCCAGKKQLEVCSQCSEFPCPRLGAWADADSFVTHQRCRPNLDSARAGGLKAFIRQQGKRMGLLETMLAEFDEGRSKSFHCLAVALLPLEALEASLREASKRAGQEGIGPGDRKARAGLLRSILTERAAGAGVELKLRRK